MKKIYLPLVAIATLLAFSATVVAQRPKMEFNQQNSTRWTDPGNWKRNGVQQTTATGVLPQDGDSIYIAGGFQAYIAPGSGSGTTTITLNNVIVTVQSNAALQLGNGGQRLGVLALDNASTVSLEGSGASAGKIVANPSNDSRNQITLGGVIKYESDLTYTVNANSGPGVVAGPSRAAQFTGSGVNGFTAGTLPVVLVGFNANLASDGKVSIKWSTQQEISTDHFDLQRSSDGIQWQTIATVKASGYSSVQRNYSVEDGAPQAGTNLYRLRMIDFDANFGFSSVANVHLNALGKISLFPNPAVNFITISLGRPPMSDWTCTLVNLNGQVMLNKKFSKDITTANLPVSNLANGNYTVEIADGISKQVSKLMIAHQ